MKGKVSEVRASIHPMVPHMEKTNEEMITQAPHETTCYSDYDVVHDSNYPTGLEVVSHGKWHYGPRGN